MSRNKIRTMAASINEDIDFFQGLDDHDSTTNTYHPPKQHMGRKLRKRNIPYDYAVTDEQVFEGTEYKLPIGFIKPLMGRGEVDEFDNVRYAGGYVWKEAFMRDQLGVDHRAPGPRVFETPAVPDVLGDPTTIGHVDSDLKSGMIDYIIDVRDASFLRPTFSPFESLIHSLAPSPSPEQTSPALSQPSVLDSLDIIVDHTTLLHIINFLRDPINQVCRTECQFTSDTGAVVMHHWLPKIMYGAGEPHRGYVQSYTRRVTAPLRDGGWNGGTVQMVRYDLGGMGMLVRYPVQAKYTFNTKMNEITKNVTRIPHNDNDDITAVDRNRFMAIKVLNLDPRSKSLDLDDLYVRLLLTQSENCLIAPHFKGDFKTHSHSPQVVSIHDPIFDEARAETDSLLKQAIGFWRNMVNITRKLGRNVSFVGNEDGSIEVLGMKKGPYEHVNLSKMALGMLDDASPSELDKGTQGYTEYDRTKKVGDWAIINSHDGSVSTWGNE